jgi:Ca2+-binding EF-hand superfamily protein
VLPLLVLLVLRVNAERRSAGTPFRFRAIRERHTELQAAKIISALNTLHGLQGALEAADGLLLVEELLEANEQRVLLTSVIDQLESMKRGVKALTNAVRANRDEEIAHTDLDLDKKLQLVDTNGDGQLSYQELYVFFEQKKLEELKGREKHVKHQFLEYDLNGNGKVTSSEFTQQYNKDTKAFGAKSVTFQTLLSYFSFADTNGSNELDVSEFGGLYHLFGLDGSVESEVT